MRTPPCIPLRAQDCSGYLKAGVSATTQRDRSAQTGGSETPCPVVQMAATPSVSEASFSYARRVLEGKEVDVEEVFLVTHGTFRGDMAVSWSTRVMRIAVTQGDSTLSPSPHSNFGEDRRARLRAQMNRRTACWGPCHPSMAATRTRCA